MYKSSLQEFCQSKKWNLPKYTIGRQGLDHCPMFEATVTVNDSVFSTTQFSKSVKEAQNLAAKIAYERLTGTFSAGASQVVVTSVDAQNPIVNQPLKASSSTGVNLGNKDDKIVKDMPHLYKNQLQTYAQKRNLSLPKYHCEREGPPHAPRFRSLVLLDGRTYQTKEFFHTLKDAENAAAKSALMSLSSEGIEEKDSGFYKNMLQELAHRVYSCLPVYNTIGSGPSHDSVFVSTVKIHDASFTGQEAKTKKLAELHAAKVAYLALKDRNNSSSECHVNDFSPMLHLRPAESADRHISEPNPVSDAVKELVKCNEGYLEQLKSQILPSTQPGVQGQVNEVKLTETCASEGQVQEPEMDAIPFLQDDDSADSSHKRIKVFPATPNMRLPEAVVVMRKGDKWVAVRMDSS